MMAAMALHVRLMVRGQFHFLLDPPDAVAYARTCLAHYPSTRRWLAALIVAGLSKVWVGDNPGLVWVRTQPSLNRSHLEI
ncbi:uncharacterized protein VTP21DRAFT_3184 [Calcarisporiella thermophila]|uniref:uncharacterized protein n=1 Tax=Calcarisporiella thermophila TaxID=911321 RepID=UPI0037443B61